MVQNAYEMFPGEFKDDMRVVRGPCLQGARREGQCRSVPQPTQQLAARGFSVACDSVWARKQSGQLESSAEI